MLSKIVPFLFVLIIALVNCRPQVQSIEYQPNRPSFHPSPGSVLGQIVPPGKPWPAGPEGYANFSQTPPPVDVANRWTGDNSTSTAAPVQNNVQPASGSRPSFAWRPHDRLPQLVPSSGSLWPASPEGYANFSQTPPPVNVADRWSGDNSSASSSSSNFTMSTESSITSIGNRPFFASKPHDRLPQIVPAGAPWPANAAGYANFSQIPNNNRFQENGTTTSRVLVNDLVNIVNLTHALAPNETAATEAAPVTPRITTYRGTVPSTVVATLEEVTSTSEEVTSTEETGSRTTEAVGNRIQKVSTTPMSANDTVETTEASVVLETTSGVVSHKTTTLMSESKAPTEATSKETSTETFQAMTSGIVTSHPSTEPGQLFTSSILESNHEQHVPHHETSTKEPQIAQEAVTKPPDAQEATNEQVPQVVAPQYPQIGLFIETAGALTTTEKNQPTLKPANQANQNKPCFYPIEVVPSVVVPAQKEPSLVLVPPKPSPEVYAPSKFNDFGTTIKEMLAEIDRVTQQIPSRGQAGGPFTIPGFDFDFTKESYFGPTNSEYLPPSWFPGWIPGYNLVPSSQHHHHRYHYYKK